VWRGLIESGKKSVDEVIATAQTKKTLQEHHIEMIRATVIDAGAAA
jgi:hypothetical protein